MVLNSLSEGQIFGEYGFFTGQPRELSARTKVKKTQIIIYKKLITIFLTKNYILK